jgi:hypothetical protein
MDMELVGVRMVKALKDNGVLGASFDYLEGWLTAQLSSRYQPPSRAMN